MIRGPFQSYWLGIAAQIAEDAWFETHERHLVSILLQAISDTENSYALHILPINFLVSFFHVYQF
jgi:hypothetical protein